MKPYYQNELVTIYHGDSLSVLKQMDSETINCCVTSPPYWGLRDYGEEGQLGLEETPEQYVENMVKLFSEVKRVLRDDGTLWLNLGDSYSGSGGAGNQFGQLENDGFNKYKQGNSGLKPKDLCGIPWRVAFALQSDGWYLRQDIIWHKPNPMPESVTDRCTKSHEYIFLLSKSKKYYCDMDAIKEPITESSKKRLSQNIDGQKGSERVPGKTNGTMKAVGHKNLQSKGQEPNSFHKTRANGEPDKIYDRRNKRSVWTIEDDEYQQFLMWKAEHASDKKDVWTVNTKPYSEAHFAVYPEELIEPCIKAGCPEGGTVLDPFSGSGTTVLVSVKQNKKGIGIELSEDYIKISEKRIELFKTGLTSAEYAAGQTTLFGE